MYSPHAFVVDDQEMIWEFIARHPFAILIAKDGNITHLPINRFKNGRMYGHCARANPLSCLENGTAATAVFSGPHAYVSPDCYVSGFHAPTWNYGAVHCHGAIEYIDNETEIWSLLSEMVAIYEGTEGWKLPNDDRFRQLIKGLRFFELAEPTFEAKLKFNQNKSEEDILSVISHLRESNPDAAKMMVMANKALHADALKRAGDLCR